jgi:hypothetical protein
MITWDEDFLENHHVFISYGGLDSELKKFPLLFVAHGAMTFEFVCSLLHIFYGTRSRSCQRFNRMMDVLNCSTKIMIM